MTKRGVSVIIGYVLLVVFAIVIGGGVYAWLKTYVPAEALNCPDGVSVFLKDSIFNYSYNSTHSYLKLTVRNNGRFDVAGYIAHATVTIGGVNGRPVERDVSSFLVDDPLQGVKFGNSVLRSTTGTNALKPGDEMINTFYIAKNAIANGTPTYTSIKVTPTRFQDEDNRQRFVTCGDSRLQQAPGLNSGSCTPSCSGKQCGSDGCGGTCGTCGSNQTCNGVGQCISGGSCTGVSNPCGTRVCGSVTNGTCGNVTCGNCQSGFSCNATGQCIVTAACGNGIIDTGEQCDDGNSASGDGCSSTCQVESGWTCVVNPSPPPATTCTLNVQSCSSTCQASGYITGACTNSPGNCQSGGGTHLAAGDPYCTGGSQADTCCCSGSSSPFVLFSENFETYTVRYGTSLYTQMNGNGWTVIDNVPPIPDDDMYLNTTSVIQGTYSGLLQDDAEIIGNVSTLGFNNINLSYSRRSGSLEPGEFFKIYWRVGNSGSWTQLEQTDTIQWQARVWNLPSAAGNKTLIQIRFFLDSNSGGNNDFGYVDRINVTGA